MGLRPAKASAPKHAETAPPGLAVRRTATALLRQVIEHKVPLDSLLDEEHGNPHFLKLDQRDRALSRAILGVTLRRRGEIEAALTAALDRKLPENSAALSAILQVAAAQILFLSIPDHAAVNIAVAQAGGDRRTGRARGLVNGVLRRLAREREAILARPHATRLNTPAWLFSRWAATYGEATADRIVAAHRDTPPLDIAVKSDAADWAAKISGVLLPTGAIRVVEAGRVPDLPGYQDGAWWVQDAAAALPARLLGDVAGKSIADLCAAPGGKTAALAAAGANVTAVDLSESRLRRLQRNLDRLHLTAELVAADVLIWKPGTAFDAVLLDAPCTATGTIRRHPDIAWLKTETDIRSLSALQAKMLDRAASLVTRGGVLVVCTCSLEPEEGPALVAPFLAKHGDFSLTPIDADEIFGLRHLLTPEGMLRTLPSEGFGDAPSMQGMDGFFAARFRRA